MSIYGPEPCESEIETEQENSVKKTYVDIQDSRRLLKDGDNMTGDLQMNGNLVRGLPTNYPPLYSGDEAASWSQTVDLIRDSNVNIYKPVIITIQAAVRRKLERGKFQWSFGDAGGRYQQEEGGYTMMAPGRVIRMGLAATVNKDVTVCIVRNGEAQPQYCVTKRSAYAAGTAIFSTPLEVEMGDTLNFRTETHAVDTQFAVVTLLIELDM